MPVGCPNQNHQIKWEETIIDSINNTNIYLPVCSQIGRGHFSGYADTNFSIKTINLEFVLIIIFSESFELQNHTVLTFKGDFSINIQPNLILFAILKSLFYSNLLKCIKANFYQVLFKNLFLCVWTDSIHGLCRVQKILQTKMAFDSSMF